MDVTKVLNNRLGLRILGSGIVLLGWAVVCRGQIAVDAGPAKPAESLYLQLGKVPLDPAQVYKVRDATLTRSSIQISLEDGTIAFTQDVLGKITGAFFEGYGEILLTPPNETERKSMGLFTGMAILAERFETAYFRFNDDVPHELAPGLRAPGEDEKGFVDHWGSAATNLAAIDAMRMLTTFSRLLPVDGKPVKEENDGDDRFLHARLQGTKLGVFDVYFDSRSPEQIQAGQVKTTPTGETYYDVWTSFSPLQFAGKLSNANDDTTINDVQVRRYAITTSVIPPKQIHARARLECKVRTGGQRALMFELSRFLQVDQVKVGGVPVEFIHNTTLEGTQISRRGNDVVAVILPEPSQAGQEFEIEFDYGGEVLAEAGSGLLYVGARGTWYPNRGAEMADFDLSFTYPQGWHLVATGKPMPAASADGKQVAGEQNSHWVSERPIPLAGFNLGKYREVTTQAGGVTVETYAAEWMERDFPKAPIEVVGVAPASTEPEGRDTAQHAQIVIPSQPSPMRQEASVGEQAAQAIQYFAERFGPFPYSHLELAQIPGADSQGWPGLVFLSSYAFLNRMQREQLHFTPQQILMQETIPAHETAHQWWGDLINWRTYRDQWFTEGLANYCALMMLQEKDPAGFRGLMEAYRLALVEKNKDGVSPADAGPVTFGMRLLSSRFPEGYEAISYGRGTWLFHMLRTMLQDGARQDGKSGSKGGEEPFMRSLRKLREKYEGRAISSKELMDVFAEDLPASLRFEGKPSLDWFLDGWINGSDLPKLELKGVKFTPKKGGVSVSGTILQTQASKDLVTSVPLYGVTAGKQPVFLGRVFADGDETSFRLSGPVGTRKVVLDPYATVLTAPK